MHKEFDQLELLIEELNQDKQAGGAGASIRNRYPVRFILFDDFSSASTFVSKVVSTGVVKMQELAEWVDKCNPDIMLTRNEVGKKILEYIKENDTSDSVIVPFSELARFYPDEDFKALIKHIRGVQATKKGVEYSQRIYIPMIGQYGKMSFFFDDQQCFCWRLTQSIEQKSYEVILTPQTYGVKGLEQNYTIIKNLSDWLNVWRDEKCLPRMIIQSESINKLYVNARPDNAINYIHCSNVKEFLSNGLGLDFSSIPYTEEDDDYWCRLATKVNSNSFTLESFFNNYFGINDLNDHKKFMKLWFNNQDSFHQWLLISYYLVKVGTSGYLGYVLSTSCCKSTSSLVSALVLKIFEVKEPETYLHERSEIISLVKTENIRLQNDVEKKVREELEAIVADSGHETALRYNEGFAQSEKELIIEWVGSGNIDKSKIGGIFPELQAYMDNIELSDDTSVQWIWDYMTTYKQCKIANSYSDNIKSTIAKKNGSKSSFYSWYNSFKTTRTELANRSDIEVFYWIDGLGIDWIPFIIKQIADFKGSEIYVNEVKIARSLLPTITQINKTDLEILANGSLLKKGNLDEHAHKNTQYPQYLIEEMEIVSSAIKDIIQAYSGKKVAIISDHGISYLSQFCDGYNIGGVETNHRGRCGKRLTTKTQGEGKFIVLDDNNTICALKHGSLESKVPNGQGAHGGCTPEEVLVPIIILSSHKTASEYKISLITSEVLGSNPVVRFSIKGLSNIDTPKVVYNNCSYDLNHLGDKIYETSRIALEQNVTIIKVCIGDYHESFNIKVNLGAQEVDLFDF